MGHNEADAVRSVRPKGKKCREYKKDFYEEFLSNFRITS
jgi:hypothetical protein